MNTPTYLALAIDASGSVRSALTTKPEVPEFFCRPGEIAFVIQPLDLTGRHGHEYPLPSWPQENQR